MNTMSELKQGDHCDLPKQGALGDRARNRRASTAIHALFRHPHAPVPTLGQPAGGGLDKGVTAVESQLPRIRGQTCALILEHGRAPRGAWLLLTIVPTSARSHHWQERISLMLMPDEVLSFLLVLTGTIPHSKVERGKGSLRKEVELYCDGGATYISAQYGAASRRIPLALGDATRLAIALLAKFRSTAPESVGSEILTLIGLVARRQQQI
jgi:hypothetical protein